ncbi:aquaporin Z [Friedmanniella endophytica]|uniref:Aquaporin Z n=1 Tax=Microlunatus kandeliicorticis TaxID=1759536 RepID=A0A7W3P7E1_9ACTN|nr:aquaporin Z [Microlunatus kandeliicorticis]MBA8795928.1 aquaporin Z [Microlunatus kandeliicorticis]
MKNRTDAGAAAAGNAPTAAAEPTPSVAAKLGAELIGTFVLVFGGCGTAIFAATAQTPTKIEVGVGYVGVALAFGLTVLVMAAAVGPISGGHFNPAVTTGAAIAGRLEPKLVPLYWIAQVLGASVAGGVLYLIASGRPGFDPVGSGFASNGYGDRSPGGFSLASGAVTEIVLTAVFVLVILLVTEARRALSWAPVAIGLTLTLIHLISIPVTNTSVNPARSLGVAWFAGPAALSQVWLFIVAPLVGGAIAAFGYRLATHARS